MSDGCPGDRPGRRRPTAGATRRPASSGCCTSTSTSSSRPSRSCATPSSRGCRSSSAGGATRPSAAWCRRRRTPPASSASAPACRCGSPLRKCPDAVFLPVDGPAYDEASQRGDGDAAVAGLGRRARGARGARLGRGVPRGRAGATATSATRATSPRRSRPRCSRATRLHCSVGIGDNKLRAKIATDFGKPRGTWQLTGDNWFEVMGQRPTDALWGIGSKTSKKLAALGIDTVDAAGALRRPDAGRAARPDDGPVVPPARPGRRPEPGRRHAVGAAGARAGGDVPGGPRRLGRRRARRCAR